MTFEKKIAKQSVLRADEWNLLTQMVTSLAGSNGQNVFVDSTGIHFRSRATGGTEWTPAVMLPGDPVTHPTPTGAPSPTPSPTGTQAGFETSDPQTDTWDRSDPPAGTDGVRIRIQTRMCYDHTQDYKLWAYYRVVTFSSNGVLKSISAETRIEVDAPVAYP
jgi:hypothetical protein